MVKNIHEEYQGDSKTEALAWENAIKKNIDLSVEARLERAENMGFDIDTIYHHGTSRKFDRFDKNKIGENYIFAEDSGFFFTKKKASAENYAELHTLKDGGTSRVISVYLKYKNPYIMTTNSDYYSPADRFDVSNADIMHEVMLEHHDAVIIKGTKNDDLCIVFDPSQILSIHAAFDLETENYKPFINLDDAIEKFFLKYEPNDESGNTIFKELISDYYEQEKNSLSIECIKNNIEKCVEFYEFPNEEKIKNKVSSIIDSIGIENKTHNKRKNKMTF